MKLLFDQNISFKVIKGLEEYYPEARQVRNLKLENSTDQTIWNYAKQNGYTIVTFDSDFYDLNLLYGSPPKIVWLRSGNTSTENLIRVFIDNFDLIKEFILDPNYSEIGCLEIGKEISET